MSNNCLVRHCTNIVTVCARQNSAVTTHALNRASIERQQEQELVTILCCQKQVKLQLLRMLGQHFIKYINPPSGQGRAVSLVEAVIIRSPPYKCSCPWRHCSLCQICINLINKFPYLFSCTYITLLSQSTITLPFTCLIGVPPPIILGML
jgi:hypothetical protein